MTAFSSHALHLCMHSPIASYICTTVEASVHSQFDTPHLAMICSCCLPSVAVCLAGKVSFIWAAAVLHVLSQTDCTSFLKNAHCLLAPDDSLYGWTIGAKKARKMGNTPDGKQKRWAHSTVSNSKADYALLQHKSVSMQHCIYPVVDAISAATCETPGCTEKLNVHPADGMHYFVSHALFLLFFAGCHCP